MPENSKEVQRNLWWSEKTGKHEPDAETERGTMAKVLGREIKVKRRKMIAIPSLFCSVDEFDTKLLKIGGFGEFCLIFSEM